MKINLTLILNICCFFLVLYSFEVLENPTGLVAAKNISLVLLGVMNTLTTIGLLFMIKVARNYKIRQRSTIEAPAQKPWLRYLNLVVDLAVVVALYRGVYHQELFWVEMGLLYHIVCTQIFAFVHNLARTR